MADAIPAFDPSKPYEIDAPPFDPTQPYEELGAEQDQPKIPQAFLDRLRAGYELRQAVQKPTRPNPMVEPEGLTTGLGAAARIAGNTAKAFLHGYSESELPTPTGSILWDAGANAFDIVNRLFHGGIAAAGGGAEQIARELGLPRPEQLGRDISGMAEIEAMGVGTLGTTHFSRVTPDGLQRIGTVPRNEDFADAATVLTHKPGSFTAFHGSPAEFSEFAGEGVDVTPDRRMAERYRQPRGQASRGPGNLYQVEVGASQDAFLNLDRSLNGQSDQVKAALGKAGIAIDDRLGMDAWDALRDAGDAKTAAKTLQAAGIAGTSRVSGTYSVFNKDIVNITHRNDQAVAEENLRDLWDQRGIHPAEAAHDAQSDAFLKRDLTRPNPDPTDRSDIIPPRGSPIAEGTPRTELAKTGEPHIDSVLDSPVTNRNIDNPVIVDSFDVPYGAGGSEPLENPAVFIDRHFPRSMEVEGVTFDPADPFTIHENIEQHVMEVLTKGGMDDATAYSVAHHEWAEKAEGAWYRAHGIDQAKAEEAYRPFLDQIEHENPRNPPQNLYEKPYPHQDVRSAEAGPVPEPTKADIARAMEIVADAMEREGASVGAARTPASAMPSLAVQPPPPAGSLLARAREAIDKLFGLGRNIQFLLDPMATGSSRAMVIAKDAANAVRRIDWEWRRIDDEIMRRFTPEQQERMWNAGDEESVALQLGEDRTHQGWATLEPDERAFVEYVDGLGQRAWLNAVDAGLVEGEGLPAYMPRMLLNVAVAEGKSPRALNELGRNVFTKTAQMLKREHMMAEETEEAMRAKFGDEAGIARNVRALPLAIAKLEKAAVWKGMIDQIEEIGKATGTDTVANFKPGEGWFTIAGHPAFTKWKPDLERNPVDGKWMARTDDAGNVIFRPQPIWISPEFKGPLRSILDEPADMMKAVPGAPSLYSALMTLKGKAMTAILNSPLIHNEVVWGKVMEAAGGREWLGFGLYFRGNRIVNNPARAGELIERGLNPIGPRGSIQDITAMLEQPNMQAGRSWTAQLLGAIPGLFDPAAGDAVRRAVDRAGDFWHNTLLWDRVRDVQFGLADHLSDHLVSKGVRRDAADRIAAHFSNIIVGSIPKETMSAGAQAAANIMLFSRSFTLGNLSTFKQAFTGLPKPIVAQIERDFSLGITPDGEFVHTPGTEAAFNSAKGIARRKAISTIAMSAGLFYVGNALFQHAFNIASRDSSLEEEINGYARRYRDFMQTVKEDPFELRHILSRLSPTADNEPQKSDRVHIGYDQDGTAIYGRLPFGKFGEEMVGYPTMPLEMLKRKLNPQIAAAFELVENDKGFGRKIYDDTQNTAANDIRTAFAFAKHLISRQMPEGQITAAADLLRGDGDSTVNKLRVFGPMAGFTASVGAPGGMAKGEQLAAKQSFETRFNLAWPDIKKQIRRGDIESASQAMMDLGVPLKMQRGLIRAATMPGNLSGRTLQDFFQYATPEQQNRLLNAR